jgi:hypothetical protein
VAKRGDIWHDVFDQKQDLERALAGV